jgi:hypothetical protein
MSFKKARRINPAGFSLGQGEVAIIYVMALSAESRVMLIRVKIENPN